MPSPFAGSGAGALAGAGRALCPGQRGQQPCPRVPAGLRWGCSLRAPRPLRPSGGCPLRAPKLGPCVSICECVSVCLSVSARVGVCPGYSLGREAVAAGDGLNVALPALTSAIKGTNPAPPAHFFESRWIICRRKREPQCPKECISGCLLPFFSFFLITIFHDGLVPLLCVGRIKRCRVSLVPDSIKIYKYMGHKGKSALASQQRH